MRFLLPRSLCKVLDLLRLEFYVLIWRVRALIGGLEMIASLIQMLQLSVCTTHLFDIFSAKMKIFLATGTCPDQLAHFQTDWSRRRFSCVLQVYDETCLLGFVELASLALAPLFHAKMNQQHQGIYCMIEVSYSLEIPLVQRGSLPEED